MGTARVGPELSYAWYGPSVLITNHRGECGSDQALSGYFFRETRFLRELRLEINGRRPWLCAAGEGEQQTLAFNFAYPEELGYSGGGSGSGGGEVPRDEHGIPHRAFDLRSHYEVQFSRVEITLWIVNRTEEEIAVDMTWKVGADYADLMEAIEGGRRLVPPVIELADQARLRFRQEHPDLPFETEVTVDGAGEWLACPGRLTARLALSPQRGELIRLRILARDVEPVPDEAGEAERWRSVSSWREQAARLHAPGDRAVERMVHQAVADVGSLNPFGRYYGDFASPLMFVIALAHLYAWTGEKADLKRHWDAARRALDWARERGDCDGDGYLEYHTLAEQGPRNQGWKDSGEAVIYEDGRLVPEPIATCEVQGYWYAAQQLSAVLSAVQGRLGDARAYWESATDLKRRFNRDWWVEEEGFIALALDPDKRQARSIASNAGHCLTAGVIADEHIPAVVGRLFAPDMFSGWGIRTLASTHPSYNPIGYHLGSVWAVENATIGFGLRRYGFDVRFLDLMEAMLDLARLYGRFRVPECVGGYGRSEFPHPGAYPRANTPQAWNQSALPLLIHTLLGLQPVAALDLLVVDPVLPTWLPELILERLRVGGATATLRFYRGRSGESHVEVLRKRGTLHIVKQPPLESLAAGVADRFTALVDRLLHH